MTWHCEVGDCTEPFVLAVVNGIKACVEHVSEAGRIASLRPLNDRIRREFARRAHDGYTWTLPTVIVQP